MRGGEAAERVPAARLAVGRHGADDGLQVFLLLQTGGVCLGGHCRNKTRQQTFDLQVKNTFFFP